MIQAWIIYTQHKPLEKLSRVYVYFYVGWCHVMSCNGSVGQSCLGFSPRGVVLTTTTTTTTTITTTITTITTRGPSLIPSFDLFQSSSLIQSLRTFFSCSNQKPHFSLSQIKKSKIELSYFYWPHPCPIHVGWQLSLSKEMVCVEVRKP